MAYERATPTKLLRALATNVASPELYRRLGRAALDRAFDKDLAALRVVDLAALGAPRQPIVIDVPRQTWGETPLNDLVALCYLCRVHAPATVFEFGTFTGLATRHLALNSSDGASIYTLDLSPHERTSLAGLNWERDIDDAAIGELFRDTPEAERITQLFCDSRTFDESDLVAKVDLVWVDGCHEAEFVVSDSRKALAMLRPGGVVAWHDVSRACPAVARHLLDLSARYTIQRIAGTAIAFAVI